MSVHVHYGYTHVTTIYPYHADLLVGISEENKNLMKISYFATATPGTKHISITFDAVKNC